MTFLSCSLKSCSSYLHVFGLKNVYVVWTVSSPPPSSSKPIFSRVTIRHCWMCCRLCLTYCWQGGLLKEVSSCFPCRNQARHFCYSFSWLGQRARSGSIFPTHLQCSGPCSPVLTSSEWGFSSPDKDLFWVGGISGRKIAFVSMCTSIILETWGLSKLSSSQCVFTSIFQVDRANWRNGASVRYVFKVIYHL